MKTDYWSYFKLICGVFLTFPLGWAFFALDHGKETGFYIALSMYSVLTVLAFIMFNYLETGKVTETAKRYEKPF